MAPKPSLYPRGATNANWFSLFNALSFQISLGSPMILYARSLGATATVLGIIAALAPLLTIAQIPAAHFLQRIGYRRMILAGWGSRTALIFLFVPLPLITFLPAITKLSFILFTLFAFNLLRGISSGAWLPWLTDLIPEGMRGRFLSRDQIFLHVGSLASLFLCATVLGAASGGWKFSVVFLISAVAGTLSLLFLRRIPDIEPGEQLNTSNTRVPWREIVTYPPFRRLVMFNMLFVLTIGSLGVFNVAFMKTRLGVSDSVILYLTTLYFLGALITLPLLGRVLDEIGSKPILLVSMALWWVHVLGWVLLGCGLVPPSRLFIAALIFSGGFAGASFNLANVRLVMATMPAMGRSHFFAFFSVISSLTLGLSPVAWGIFLDAIGSFQKVTGPITWTRYSLYFSSLLVLCTITFAYTHALRETPTQTRPRSVLDTVRSAQIRRLTRLWQR